jgi:hypothetical protein
VITDGLKARPLQTKEFFRSLYSLINPDIYGTAEAVSRALRSTTQLENLLPSRQQPIDRTNPFWFGQALLAANRSVQRARSLYS